MASPLRSSIKDFQAVLTKSSSSHSELSRQPSLKVTFKDRRDTGDGIAMTFVTRPPDVLWEDDPDEIDAWLALTIKNLERARQELRNYVR